MRSVGLRIAGCVQGVGYRAFLRDAARATGVTGWVRNRRDGTVEAELSGSDDAVAALIEAARRGPPGSRVDDVGVSERPTPSPAPTEMTILPTG